MEKSFNRFSFIAAALLLVTSLSVAFAQRRTRETMSPADILGLANVGDAQISPDGQGVVYTVSTVAGNETISTLWIARIRPNLTEVPTNTSPPTAGPRATTAWPKEKATSAPLLAAGWNATNPRWAPDSSKIAFLAEHEDRAGVWLVSLDKPEPRFIAAVQNTNFFITYAGEALAWAPDSKRIAYVSATEEPTDEAVTSVADPLVIDRLQYKTRTSFSDKRRTHVWIVAVDKPEPRQLTTGYYYDHAIAFSPNGDEIAFLSNHEPDPDANNNSDIFGVDMHGEVRQITATKGCEYEPAWSPDGKWIAYTATKREVTTIDSVAEDTHVWVVGADGNNSAELSLALDRRARTPRWSPDSRQILFLAGDRGETALFRISVTGGKIQRLYLYASADGFRGVFDSPDSKLRENTGATASLNWPLRRPFQIGSYSVSRKTGLGGAVGGANSFSFLAFTVTSALEPAEVLFLGGGGALARIGDHNRNLITDVELRAPEEINYRSFDGTAIQGWLMKPIGWREDRKYPMILSIHGGPHGMYGWGFNPTFQVYAAQGYAVLYLNPRGSSGYGQKFSDGTLNEWGGGDYKDLMAGVDEALRKYPWIDRQRLGVTGGSYGGFMTNWIITQTPRFGAAVSAASLSNLVSFYSTSLYQDLIHAEFGGFPWDNYELLWQWSPLRYVKQAQTPTLFIHGEQDNDVHITQAEEMYAALKRLGIQTVLVRYPREGHGLREPKHRVDALERTLAWFDRYLK